MRLRFAGIDRAEAAVDQWADEVWLAAPAEAAAFAHGRWVPNDTCAPAAPEPLPEGPGRLLFVGNRRYPPNRDGLGWFLAEVWPLLRREQPELTLEVVGHGPHLALAGVVSAGFLPDVNPAYRRCHLVVAPLRFGSGTPLKILEALGRGRAVVATPAAARGIVGHPDALRLADTPAAFAAAVRKLLANPAALGDLGRAAHAWARREADWYRIMSGAVAQSLAAARTRPAAKAP